jgi:hypothetical protein
LTLTFAEIGKSNEKRVFRLIENYQVVDKVGMPGVLVFITEELKAFDTSELDWIKLLPLHQTHLLHGACTFPQRAVKRGHGYRIRASVNVEMIPPFVFEHWGRLPAPHNRRGWVSGACKFVFPDLEQCAIHTLAHECFHFLSDSGQVEQKNIEANANWWADNWLAKYNVSEIA